MKKTYRIFNRVLKKWWEGESNSVQEACKKSNWIIDDCWIREYTEKGGWKNCKLEIKNKEVV